MRLQRALERWILCSNSGRPSDSKSNLKVYPVSAQSSTVRVRSLSKYPHSSAVGIFTNGFIPEGKTRNLAKFLETFLLFSLADANLSEIFLF